MLHNVDTPKYKFGNQTGIIALLVKAPCFGLNAEQVEKERPMIIASLKNHVKHSSQNKTRICRRQQGVATLAWPQRFLLVMRRLLIRRPMIRRRTTTTSATDRINEAEDDEEENIGVINELERNCSSLSW
uniref:Uncharacterized protein n=1 Tax=Anopheles quadriannulatus TaxID=34691 RepID=A0A182XPE0_ANOQN